MMRLSPYTAVALARVQTRGKTNKIRFTSIGQWGRHFQEVWRSIFELNDDASCITAFGAGDGQVTSGRSSLKWIDKSMTMTRRARAKP